MSPSPKPARQSSGARKATGAAAARTTAKRKRRTGRPKVKTVPITVGTLPAVLDVKRQNPKQKFHFISRSERINLQPWSYEEDKKIAPFNLVKKSNGHPLILGGPEGDRIVRDLITKETAKSQSLQRDTTYNTLKTKVIAVLGNKFAFQKNGNGEQGGAMGFLSSWTEARFMEIVSAGRQLPGRALAIRMLPDPVAAGANAKVDALQEKVDKQRDEQDTINRLLFEAAKGCPLAQAKLEAILPPSEGPASASNDNAGDNAQRVPRDGENENDNGAGENENDDGAGGGDRIDDDDVVVPPPDGEEEDVAAVEDGGGGGGGDDDETRPTGPADGVAEATEEYYDDDDGGGLFFPEDSDDGNAAAAGIPKGEAGDESNPAMEDYDDDGGGRLTFLEDNDDDGATATAAPEGDEKLPGEAGSDSAPPAGQQHKSAPPKAVPPQVANAATPQKAATSGEIAALFFQKPAPWQVAQPKDGGSTGGTGGCTGPSRRISGNDAPRAGGIFAVLRSDQDAAESGCGDGDGLTDAGNMNAGNVSSAGGATAAAAVAPSSIEEESSTKVVEKLRSKRKEEGGPEAVLMPLSKKGDADGKVAAAAAAADLAAPKKKRPVVAKGAGRSTSMKENDNGNAFCSSSSSSSSKDAATFAMGTGRSVDLPSSTTHGSDEKDPGKPADGGGSGDHDLVLDDIEAAQKDPPQPSHQSFTKPAVEGDFLTAAVGVRQKQGTDIGNETVGCVREKHPRQPSESSPHQDQKCESHRIPPETAPVPQEKVRAQNFAPAKNQQMRHGKVSEGEQSPRTSSPVPPTKVDAASGVAVGTAGSSTSASGARTSAARVAAGAASAANVPAAGGGASKPASTSGTQTNAMQKTKTKRKRAACEDDALTKEKKKKKKTRCLVGMKADSLETMSISKSAKRKNAASGAGVSKPSGVSDDGLPHRSNKNNNKTKKKKKKATDASDMAGTKNAELPVMKAAPKPVGSATEAPTIRKRAAQGRGLSTSSGGPTAGSGSHSACVPLAGPVMAGESNSRSSSGYSASRKQAVDGFRNGGGIFLSNTGSRQATFPEHDVDDLKYSSDSLQGEKLISSPPASVHRSATDNVRNPHEAGLVEVEDQPLSSKYKESGPIVRESSLSTQRTGGDLHSTGSWTMPSYLDAGRPFSSRRRMNYGASAGTPMNSGALPMNRAGDLLIGSPGNSGSASTNRTGGVHHPGQARLASGATWSLDASKDQQYCRGIGSLRVPGGTTIGGFDTHFTKQLAPGDMIRLRLTTGPTGPEQPYEVKEVVSDTHLETTSPIPATFQWCPIGFDFMKTHASADTISGTGAPMKPPAGRRPCFAGTASTRQQIPEPAGITTDEAARAAASQAPATSFKPVFGAVSVPGFGSKLGSGSVPDSGSVFGSGSAPGSGFGSGSVFGSGFGSWSGFRVFNAGPGNRASAGGPIRPNDSAEGDSDSVHASTDSAALHEASHATNASVNADS